MSEFGDFCGHSHTCNLLKTKEVGLVCALHSYLRI